MPVEKLKIVIVDDESRSETWEREIQEILGDSAEVIALNLEAVKKEVAAIFMRRRKFADVAAELSVLTLGIECIFDTAHILILDYDLRHMDDSGAEWTTGAEVAMTARGYSTVGSILLVNRNGNNRFDLTMTIARGSKADVEIGMAQISNPGLWAQPHSDGYRPWSWPNLLKDHQYFEETVNWIYARLTQPVFKSIGFNSGDGANEKHVQKAHWLQLGIDPNSGTFFDLVSLNPYLAPRDRESILKDKKQCARVAGAILRAWLDKIVVPSQDLLIDAPHAAYLMPWLLKDINDAECWNATTSPEDPYAAFKIDIHKYEFSPPFLLSRPAFFRLTLEADAQSEEPSGFNYNNIPDLVFCEDISQFLEFPSARAFPCSLDTAETQRYVCDPEMYTAGTHKTSDVDYEPSVLFAL